MRAVVLPRYGHAPQPVELPDPVPGPRQVLVRTVASGVNHADERIRTGQLKTLFPRRLPCVMGGELSGEVLAVGAEVTDLSVGEHVYGYTGANGPGTWAELVAVDAAALSPAPRSVPLVEAAALPVVALTAWQALVDLARLEPGQTVLVHGGAGGVGTAVIQLARHLGARVATTVSASSAETVRALGAEIVIDYRTQDFVEQLAHTPVDIVIDTQGGEVTTRSLEVTRPGGIVIGIAGTPEPSLADRIGAGAPVRLALAAMSLRLRRQARRLGVRYRFLFIIPDGAALRQAAALVDDGLIRPVVARVLPLERAPQALALVNAGARGKVLVSTVAEAVTDDADD